MEIHVVDAGRYTSLKLVLKSFNVLWGIKYIIKVHRLHLKHFT